MMMLSIAELHIKSVRGERTFSLLHDVKLSVVIEQLLNARDNNCVGLPQQQVCRQRIHAQMDLLRSSTFGVLHRECAR